jgi:hypothetical protein
MDSRFAVIPHNGECAGCTLARRQRRHRTRGALLVLALVLLLLLSLLGAATLTVARHGAAESGRAVAESQAFWAAEAGLHDAIAWAHKGARPLEEDGLVGHGVLSGTVLTGFGVEAAFSVDVFPDPDWPAGNVVRRYIVTSRGTAAGQAQKVVRMDAELQTFASYMHASHHEETPRGDPIYFAQYDVIDGPIYVNDQIHVWKDPVILQIAVSAADSVEYRAGADASVFRGGLALSAPMLDFQGVFSTDYVAVIKARAEAGGRVLQGDHDLLFTEAGELVHNPTSDPTALTTVALSTINGAVYVNGAAAVSGVLRGAVTVAAETTITVGRNGQDLVYASARNPTPWSPGFNPAAVTDSLGLVARHCVMVMGYDAKNDNKKETAVTVHAAVLVTGETPTAWGFCARWAQETIGLPPLNFFGSVAQYRRGLIGREPTGSGAPPPAKGYSKNFKYDTRFQEQPPLHFPHSTYRFSRWRQSGG